jgi:hypothetical protein
VYIKDFTQFVFADIAHYVFPVQTMLTAHYVSFADFTNYVFIAVFTYYVFAAYSLASKRVLHNPVASLHNPVADFTYYGFMAVFTYYVFAGNSFASRKVIRRQREEREKRESGCAHVHHFSVLQVPTVLSPAHSRSSQPAVLCD